MLKFNVSRFNSEHNLEGLYHLRKKRIFTLTSHSVFDNSFSGVLFTHEDYLAHCSLGLHPCLGVSDRLSSILNVENMDVCFSLCSCG